MAYVQITTRCNMLCAHCCMSATLQGEDMSHEVFMASMQLVERYGELLTIGGGEPTIHPHFMTFLELAFKFHNDGRLEMPPLVITNGKRTKVVRKLMSLIDNDAPLHLELSQDEYHDPINPDTVEWFRTRQRGEDARSKMYMWGGSASVGEGYAGIRTVKSIVAVGRAADPARGLTLDPDAKCCCDDFLIAPDGSIYSCGCKHTKIGTVFDEAPLLGYDREFAHYGGAEGDRSHYPEVA